MKQSSKWRRAAPIVIPLSAVLLFGVVCAAVIFRDAGHRLGTLQEMQTVFRDSNYRLADVREGKRTVPRIFLDSLPRDFHMIEGAGEKCELFFKFMLPLILRENEELAAARKRAAKIASRRSPSHSDRLWLQGKMAKYRVSDAKALLAKLDSVSVSLALAQAALESGFGASRFAIEANALFGEWSYNGTGIIPLYRPSGMTHRVKSFDSIAGSIQSYIFNLNQTRYYFGYRKMRARMRESGGYLDGHELAKTMYNYSTRRGAYIREVQKIIDRYSLSDFETASLERAK
ncbi:MAG: glucosaminidase domain-containing protein [Rickettsiales bacterium]|jgi:Bax protein|nr:glucosaminidase domain-containing protein [Rickettsiales bacterium]